MSTKELQTNTPTGRFAVSESGMRELNANRAPWDLIKELIQNAWDEAPSTTYCSVNVEPQPDSDTTTVTVEDDGPEFSDVSDAYTLMGHTKKRLNPTQRGRFNTGEKDVISVAIEAKVETVGQTVTFPTTGSRDVTPNSRKKGTVVTTLMPWSQKQSNQLVATLRSFRPPLNCPLFVNADEVPLRPAVAVRKVSLQTVIQHSANEPMSTRQRNTEIHLVEPYDPDVEKRIYEMGIPVQAIECPFDVDVMQKIPMSQERNAVSETYLNSIYAEVLNERHRSIEQDEFGTQWVKRAIENRQIKEEAVKSTIKGRYGHRNAVFETLDQDANRRANDNGYGVINPNNLSKKEIQTFRDKARVKDSDEVFPTPPPPQTDYEAKPDTDQTRFAEWVVKMAGYCNLTATVRYFDEPSNPRLSDCSAATDIPTLRFNEALLGQEFFQPPYGSVEHWNLLFHELGHALANQSTGHDEAWGEGTSKASALIAAHLILENADDSTTSRP